jgi:peptide deformylase
MALLKIVAWPDPVLTTPAEPVTKFDDELKKLAEDMFETMYAAPGVGSPELKVGLARRLL